jgi:S1-C subfamily serine protease
MEASELDANAEKINKTNLGALIKQLDSESPAAKSGIAIGDVVVKIQDKAINSKADFDEHMSYYRPGDKIKINYYHNGQLKESILQLTNQDGGIGIQNNSSISSESLGADFSAVSKVEQQKFKISSGVKVKNIRAGLINNLNIEDGFIFVKFNGKPCTDAQALVKDLEKANGRMQIEGIGADGGKRFYNFW